jgi:hypothetical protein
LKEQKTLHVTFALCFGFKKKGNHPKNSAANFALVGGGGGGGVTQIGF